MSYKRPGEFKGGTIPLVALTVEGAHHLDLEMPPAAALALDRDSGLRLASGTAFPGAGRHIIGRMAGGDIECSR